ncbi:PEP-CTERM sorting domain-containing protein [Colwellia sp. Arc7-635]|jgi:hypothetical protein|uniref:PEP-CTERM sorting domain-containing protein n=1 Tax=Colwellia sp. Arc7-635 TaxID=2497879 RepID=UPI000F850826|nr:PEP-CTERM sorting domain-containing protein [Colwellia sp. Arc7-635]AZQ84450.1 PEP-CTERM sorting domain-containing protein [Colwellia sp. Arc7-635]
MSSKIINIIAVCMLSLFIVDRANAGLMVGEIYSDDAGIQWQYVGLFDLANGKNYTKNGIVQNVQTYNGIEAAELNFGPLTGDAIYALSSNKYEEFVFEFGGIDGFVNHKAYYDSFKDSINQSAENISTDNAGGLGYDAVGDLSAFVHDRSTVGQYENHVFKSISVPEPSTIAIFSLALAGLMVRRLKK